MDVSSSNFSSLYGGYLSSTTRGIINMRPESIRRIRLILKGLNRMNNHRDFQVPWKPKGIISGSSNMQIGPASRLSACKIWTVLWSWLPSKTMVKIQPEPWELGT